MFSCLFFTSELQCFNDGWCSSKCLELTHTQENRNHTVATQIDAILGMEAIVEESGGKPQFLMTPWRRLAGSKLFTAGFLLCKI